MYNVAYHELKLFENVHVMFFIRNFRCHRVLEPKGIDIVHIITSPDKTIFDNILHSFVGIAAVQIGLTDILRELGIFPDKIIGIFLKALHSIRFIELILTKLKYL